MVETVKDMGVELVTNNEVSAVMGEYLAGHGNIFFPIIWVISPTAFIVIVKVYNAAANTAHS